MFHELISRFFKYLYKLGIFASFMLLLFSMVVNNLSKQDGQQNNQKRTSKISAYPGYIEILSYKSYGTHLRIPSLFFYYINLGRYYFHMIYNGEIVNMISHGKDLKPYFVNGYFVDFEPPSFVKNKWYAQALIATKVKYQFDNKLFGKEDVWQTSRETYKKGRGDCEDYSILLADWLCMMGYDARVVTGLHKKEGHAWVVLFENNQVYLIEATWGLNTTLYPLAKYSKDYYPEFMFNKEYMWVNKGSNLTKDYQGKQWEMTSRFYRYK